MLSSFIKDTGGNIAMLTAVAAVSIVTLSGTGIDMMGVRAQKANLQALADNAVLAAVREMTLATAEAGQIETLALDYVESAKEQSILSIAPVADMTTREVKMTIRATPRTSFPGPLSGMKSISVTATAQLSGGGGNVCMIGLSPVARSTIRILSSAQITAESCAIYSNSNSRASMTVARTAKVLADFVCVAGGYQGPENQDGAEPVEDCLRIEDPLAERRVPPVGDCDYTNKVVDGREQLKPGTYCGGLEINGGEASLQGGVYIMSGGPLIVTDGGTLSGDYVGFYLADEDAKIGFDYEANIDISAPREGIMSGMLIMSHPYNETLKETGLVSGLPVVSAAESAVVDTANNATRLGDGMRPADHTIRSDNARRMVGTIYLPGGKLVIDGRDPIADQSEYTVIIADTFELQDGPNLVLRTDYDLSDIPVPDGVGPNRETFPILVE